MTTDLILLNKENFINGIRRLEAAFRQQPLSEESIKIYYEFLRKYPDEFFKEAVEQCISTETFFPSIKYFTESMRNRPKILTIEQLKAMNE